MSHILITFIGKGEKDSDDLYKSEKYHFEDDDKEPYYETNFFGSAVFQYLKNNGKKPNKFVVLGTPSSMWNGLFELKGEPGSQYEDKWAELSEVIEDNTIYPEDEEKEKAKVERFFPILEEFLNQYLGDIECKLHVIPYGETQTTQIAILEKIAECVNKKDTVSLDITHGLRHLPMLTVLSAMYLEVVKKVTIDGIYYGAEGIKNRNEGIVRALNLKGLLGIAHWVGALKSFEKDSDYGVFAELLENDGLTIKQTKPLKEAAFFEHIFNVSRAARKLTTFRNNVPENLPGIGYLFTDTLKNRTEWSEKNNVYIRQRVLAYSFLGKQDYPRAAIFAVEAFITHLCKQNNSDTGDYHQRKATEYDFLDGNLSETEKIADFELLKKIRNTMVHVNEPRDEVKDLLESKNPQQQLEKELKKLIKRLLP
ncbi:TIGR02221 family CRISPR-associated protein [Candidatus Parabeggiatoa sp. HSG14]|uniref:TIGR02221 family CRISPR-associated protein n=1 Tax=Candidatus Parabeggiatoa sp. HSG14 TaxID=3055593 RepID=UPI0025A7B165|nr:TIGR02221 family CRISPR-associated protein [Thiotrichales bacterium HSG14]